MAFDSEGIYGIDNNGYLVQIDTATGRAKIIGKLRDPEGNVIVPTMSGAAINFETDELYAVLAPKRAMVTIFS